MLALTFALSAPAGRDRPAKDMTCQIRHRRLVADGDISAVTRHAISALYWNCSLRSVRWKHTERDLLRRWPFLGEYAAKFSSPEL
jgi:hypothetical protein